MKISIDPFCYDCYEDAKKKGIVYKYDDRKPVLVELNEVGLYFSKCLNNHEKWMVIQEQLFQVLFDLGALALSDGYTREAVSSFASSLERFYEFIIKLILISDKNDEEVIDVVWKDIGKQSERQLGAYLSIYTHKFKKVPSIPSTKWVKFRNEVTHNGMIPSESKTLEYGQLISDLIFDTLLDLKNYYKGDISNLLIKVYNFNYRKMREKNSNLSRVCTATYLTLIQLGSIESEEFQRLNMKDEIKRLRGSENFLRFVYIK